MAQKIHYRDDLFVLSTLARAFEAALSVEADPEFFRERISGDAFFLDASLRTFRDLLIQNSHLIERSDYLRLLEGLARGFSGSIGRLIAGDYPHAEAYSAYEPQFRGILGAQKGIIQEIRGILDAESGEEGESDLVSEDELSELLRL